MRFTPKEETERNGLIEPGIYDCTIERCEETVSKAGNDMLVMTVCVYDKNGQRRIVTDYLTEAGAYKLRHFCEAADMLDLYESGVLSADDCQGRSLKCKVRIDKEKDGYPAKNSIADYVGEQAKAQKKSKPAPLNISSPGAPDFEQAINEAEDAADAEVPF